MVSTPLFRRAPQHLPCMNAVFPVPPRTCAAKPAKRLRAVHRSLAAARSLPRSAPRRSCCASVCRCSPRLVTRPGRAAGAKADAAAARESATILLSISIDRNAEERCHKEQHSGRTQVLRRKFVKKGQNTRNKAKYELEKIKKLENFQQARGRPRKTILSLPPATGGTPQTPTD